MSRRASGLKAWVGQHITAVYMLLFTLIGGICIATQQPITYTVWKEWVAQPLFSLSLLIFFIALLMHAWVGVRNVLIDYIKPISLRIFLLSLLVCGLLGSGLWVIEIVIRAQIS
jgi:succinate dehydrogenase / fumarate reductase membrane anchor subunit